MEDEEKEANFCFSKTSFEESEEFTKLLQCLAASNSAALDVERMCLILDKYQEQPQLLDPHLEQILSFLTSSILELLKDPDNILIYYYCRVVYRISKVRGPKSIGIASCGYLN